MTRPTDLTVALLPWGDVIEDYLDELDMTVDAFLEEMSGGWMFGYVDALASAGVRTVLVVVSRAVSRPERRLHRATGATAWLLPSPHAYRTVRARLASSWAADRIEASGGRHGISTVVPEIARNVAPWCATPVRALARVVREERCDALLVQEYEEARFDLCVALGRLLRRPVFATFQGGSVARTRLEHFTRPWTIEHCAGLVVASSDEVARLHEARHVPDDRIARIVNPIDVDLWRPEPKRRARAALGIRPDERVAVWHGRVDLSRKGLDTLVAAWREVVEQRWHAPPHLRLVGSGRDAAALHALVDGLAEAAATVTWRDEYVNDRAVVRTELSAADVYVLPSRHEGFAVAPVEAMACGLPVVATAAPGIRDLVEGGSRPCGTVVAVGDAHALATALGTLLDDPARSRALGTAARARVESSFSIPAVGAALRAFLVARTRSVKGSRHRGALTLHGTDREGP
jgi:starch synthase